MKIGQNRILVCGAPVSVLTQSSDDSSDVVFLQKFVLFLCHSIHCNKIIQMNLLKRYPHRAVAMLGHGGILPWLCCGHAEACGSDVYEKPCTVSQ